MIDANSQQERGAEVLFAKACLDGDERALAELKTVYLSQIPRWLRGLKLPVHLVDDLSQRVFDCLLFADGDKPPKLSSYRGSGPLRNWLRVVSVRLALDELRAWKRQHGMHETIPTDHWFALAGNPELSSIINEHRGVIEQIVHDVVRGLPQEQRVLLKLVLVDGMEVPAVAKLYGVHRTSAYRWLDEAREAMGTQLRAAIRQALKVGDETCESLLRILRSQITLNAQALLEG